jgi:hypothetical protein
MLRGGDSFGSLEEDKKKHEFLREREIVYSIIVLCCFEMEVRRWRKEYNT